MIRGTPGPVREKLWAIGIFSHSPKDFPNTRNVLQNAVHILSLSQILRQRKETKENSFVFFQDFSKAVDLVDHRLLHYKLHKMGVTGKLLLNIMRRYKKLTACCIANGQTSEKFQVKVGTA